MNNSQTISMFKEGMCINYFGNDAVIDAIKPTFAVISYENKTISTLNPKQLNHAFKTGNLIIKKRKNAVIFQGLTSPEDIEEAEILEPFLQNLHIQTYKNSLSTALKVIAGVCKKNNISPDDAPSATTLRNKYKVYVAHGLDIVPVIKMPIKARAPRLDKAVLKITEKCLYDLYLQPNGIKASEVLKEIVIRCDNAGLSDKCLSSSQFYIIKGKLDPLEVIRARQGHDAARRLARESGGKYVLDFPLQRVEIDAVHTKVGLLDDGTLEFIGVPIIYIAIDTYTRCILAYSISWGESPGELAAAVTELIRKCVSPKTKSPKAMNDWPLTGIPYAFFGDAGKAFVAREVTLLMAQLQSHYITTETKSPWKKPFIESFNKTLRNQFCDSMPGYMRNDGEKNYDKTIEAMATFTMTEFIDSLDVFILDHYHQNPHSGLYGDTPSNYCEKALENFAPRMIQDMTMLEVIKGSEESGAIQPSIGIQKNNVMYSSPQLTALRFELFKTLKAASPRVSYFYDKSDISTIVVVNDLDGTMFQVETKDPRVKKGMSLKEFKNDLPSKITSNIATPFTRFSSVITEPIERKARLLRKKREENEQRKAKRKARQQAEFDAQDEKFMDASKHIKNEANRYPQNHTNKVLVTDAHSDKGIEYTNDEWETE
jgi:putative transposase